MGDVAPSIRMLPAWTLSKAEIACGFASTDAQEMGRRYPGTFEAPDADELKSIAPGDGVKICVTDARVRFWTLVAGAVKMRSSN